MILNAIRSIVYLLSKIGPFERLFAFAYNRLTYLTCQRISSQLKCFAIYDVSGEQVYGLSDIDLLVILDSDKIADLEVSKIEKIIITSCPWLNPELRISKLFDIMIIDKANLTPWLAGRKWANLLVKENLIIGQEFKNTNRESELDSTMTKFSDFRYAFYFYQRECGNTYKNLSRLAKKRLSKKINKILHIEETGLLKAMDSATQEHIKKWGEINFFSLLNLEYYKTITLSDLPYFIIEDTRVDQFNHQCDTIDGIVMTRRMFNALLLHVDPFAGRRIIGVQYLTYIKKDDLRLHFLIRWKNLNDKLKFNFHRNSSNYNEHLRVSFNNNLKYAIETMERNDFLHMYLGDFSKRIQLVQNQPYCEKIKTLAAEFLFLYMEMENSK